MIVRVRVLVVCAFLGVLAVAARPAEAGKPITGCCERAGKCGNVHGGFEAGLCEGGMIQGRHYVGKVCPNPNSTCQPPAGRNPKDQDDSGEIEYACAGLPLQATGTLTCKLDDAQPAPDVLTIPTELGGGAITTQEFTAAFAVDYRKLDDGTYAFILTEYEARAGTATINDRPTGPSTVTLGGGVGGGSWNPTTGVVTGTFSLQTTNEIFDTAAPLYSFPSIDGTFSAQTGRLAIESKANVFWPEDSAARIGLSPKPPTPVTKKGCAGCAAHDPGGALALAVLGFCAIGVRRTRRRRA